ncbi:alanine--tRNA ligase [Sodalis sp. CWE]|uniref:alanine--tRNA ligase n=1 Tax=Sodalis sp. CWE TaxID=2803816 RepID=UPI001C7D17E8|nr:alanine--tRNA ligase [Sodalis sp. CWE]MBX4180983.1 alanine--tRNA ligase [Sodalis sp. CWE]
MNNSTIAIRQMFFDFFCSKGHQMLPSSSLVPNNDPTLLFTNAGMNQFKKMFLGMEKAPYQRIVTSQRCVRAGGKHNDLENIGYTPFHHTFFEMLGNFSFGDYFKYDAIRFAWELLTGAQWFNLSQEKLFVTVHNTDDETYTIWAKKIGVSPERIIRVGNNKDNACTSDNFWQMGETGPCGPCSEIFYIYGEQGLDSLSSITKKDRNQCIEIWNLVFMQFDRQNDGTLLSLPRPAVDTGMGLERIAAILQNVNSSYEIDLFKKLIVNIAKMIGTNNLNSKSLRVIADHIRSCSFLISDGITPSKEGRGYVLRRIIRRALRHGRTLGINEIFFYKLVPLLIDTMDKSANQLQCQQKFIEQVLRLEEEQFSRTLERGLILLNEELAKLDGDVLDADTVFRLYDTYGFPIDLTNDICREHNLRLDEAGLRTILEAKRQNNRLIRKDSLIATRNNSVLRTHYDHRTRFFGYENLQHKGKVISLFYNDQSVNTLFHGTKAMVVLDETSFYGESGGQVGDQGILKANSGIFEVIDTRKYGDIVFHHGTLKYGKLELGEQVATQVDKIYRTHICLNHSATHLLHAALRQVLKPHFVKQKGSLIDNKHLRFDFSYHEPMKPEQIYSIEEIVNEQIRRNLLIETDVITLKEAKEKGITKKIKTENSAQKFRLLKIGDFSTELCCGTHATHTGEIGIFQIISEFGIATGIRRIEAVCGAEALKQIHYKDSLIQNVAKLLKCNTQTLLNRVQTVYENSKKMKKELQKLRNQQAMQQSNFLLESSRIHDFNGTKLLVSQLEYLAPQVLRTIVDNLKNQLGRSIIVLAASEGKKVNFIVSITKDLVDQVKAYDIINNLMLKVSGKISDGKGKPELAQAGSKSACDFQLALKSTEKFLITRFRMKFE